MMTEIHVIRTLKVTGFPTRDALEAEVSRVMAELVALSGPKASVDDPALSMDFAFNTLTAEMIARGEDFEAAMACADSALRAAIHAAGGATPGWRVVQDTRTAELV